MKKCLWVILLLIVGTGRGAEPVERAAVRDLIERQARSWETGDEAMFTATLHTDAVFAYPGKRLDVVGSLKIFREWKREFRNTKLHVRRVMIDGAQFAIEYMFAATNVATGKRMASGTVAIGEVRDGKVWMWKEYLDGRVSRQQAAGELPVDEHAEPFPWPDTPASRVP